MYGATVSCPSLNSDRVNIIICATYITFVSLIRHHSGKAAYRPLTQNGFGPYAYCGGKRVKVFWRVNIHSQLLVSLSYYYRVWRSGYFKIKHGFINVRVDEREYNTIRNIILCVVFEQPTEYRITSCCQETVINIM